MTNNLEADAEVIADLYKARWQIELFFKWIKQHLKIKSFLSTSENGVKIQIWTAMITYLLLVLIQIKSLIKLDSLEILRKVEASLDKKVDLYDLLGDLLKPKPSVLEEKYLW